MRHVAPHREHLQTDGSLETLRRSWIGALPRGIDLLAATCSPSPQPARDAPPAVLGWVKGTAPLAALEVCRFANLNSGCGCWGCHCIELLRSAYDAHHDRPWATYFELQRCTLRTLSCEEH